MTPPSQTESIAKPPLLARVTANLKRDWKSHLTTLLVAMGAFFAVQLWQTRDTPSGPAPDFQLALLPNSVALQPQLATLAADGEVSLSEWRAMHPGRAVAVHIWSDWCPFCKAEESSVTRVAADWPVLTVAARSGDASKIQAFMGQRRLPWLTGIDPTGSVGKAYGLSMVPVWLVVAPNGQIASVSVGYTTEWGMRLRLWWAQIG